MGRADAIRILPGLAIPSAELSLRASRSGGPGGQHVNTSSTRVELWWDVAQSPSLTAEQRDRLLARLANRLTATGELRIVSSATRSQARNRALAVERFREVIARALAVPKRRKPTRPPRAAKERRLAAKRLQSERKQDRRRPGPED